MKQYITPSSTVYLLQTDSLMMNTSDTYTVGSSEEIQTQKKGGGIPWDDYMDYGQEEE